MNSDFCSDLAIFSTNKQEPADFLTDNTPEAECSSEDECWQVDQDENDTDTE